MEIIAQTEPMLAKWWLYCYNRRITNFGVDIIFLIKEAQTSPLNFAVQSLKVALNCPYFYGNFLDP